MSRILVAGATGYVGGRLIPRLLKSKHDVVCLIRPQSSLDRPFAADVTVVSGSAESVEDVAQAADGCRIAYYLIHSLGRDDFAEHDRAMAEAFRRGCEAAGVERIIYLGGLGEEEAELSAHLASRQEVGRVLGAGTVAVTEIRAAIIIGSGSASFEMLRSLAETLPAMITPRWVQGTRCQPAAIDDVLDALTAAIGRTDPGHEVLELGGADVVTYEEMMQGYARVAGLKRRLIVGVPILTPRLSAHWVTAVTPLPPTLARQLVNSLVNDVIVTERSAAEELGLNPIGFDEAVERALRMVEDLVIPTSWSSSVQLADQASTPDPDDPDWAGGSVLQDKRRRTTSADPAAVFAVVSGLGGNRGWPAVNWMWMVRGWIDQAVGGVGLRRGRRHPDQLVLGDAVDFWRVEAIDPDRFVRLRAEMRMPGHAWLEWRIEPAEDRSNLTLIEQHARFVPRGLAGRAYWYMLVPFHQIVFPAMLADVVKRAEGQKPHNPRSVGAAS